MVVVVVGVAKKYQNGASRSQVLAENLLVVVVVVVGVAKNDQHENFRSGLRLHMEIRS